MLQYIIPVDPQSLVTLFILEVVLILLNMVLFAWMIAVCGKVQIHINLKIFAVSSMAQYYLSLAARLAIVSIESGFFPSTPLPETDGLVIFLSVLRCYHNALVLSMLAVQLTGLILYFRPLWLFIERSLAMHYISDYEKNQRIWISMCLVTGSIVYSIFGSLSFNLDWSPWRILTFVAALVGLIGCILFYYLKKHTEKMYDELNTQHRTAHFQYSLSLRFQLEENLKSTKLIFHAIVGLALINLCGFIFFIVAHSATTAECWGRPTVQLLDVLFNLYITINGPIITIAMLMRSDYMVALVKEMMLGGNAVAEKSEDAGQIYFLQLQEQWAQLPLIRPTDRTREDV